MSEGARFDESQETRKEEHPHGQHHHLRPHPHAPRVHHDDIFRDIRAQVIQNVMAALFTIVSPILAIGWTTLSWRNMAIFWTVYLFTQNVSFFSKRFFRWRWGGGIFKEAHYYFNHGQVECISSEPLDPNKKYIIGWHPHGRLFLGIGCFISNQFEWCGPQYAASGKHVSVGIQDTMFRIPFLNIWFTLVGLVPVNKHSVRKVLNAGNSIAIIVGGIEEVLLGTYDDKDVLYLNKRKGFVKVAMDAGAGLVPAYCFGENMLFEHSSRESLAFWNWVNRYVKLGAPFPIYGRWGLPFPYRRPLMVAMGKPIFANEGETLDEFHARYVEALKMVYQSNVGSSHDPKRKLVIV